MIHILFNNLNDEITSNRSRTGIFYTFINADAVATPLIKINSLQYIIQIKSQEFTNDAIRKAWMIHKHMLANTEYIQRPCHYSGLIGIRGTYID